MSPSVQQLNMRSYRALHGESVIPQGCYCYTNMRDSGRKTEDNLPIFSVDICPYWDMDDDQPQQMNGYCWFLEKGDWEEDGTDLLFDQVKECGVNYPDDDDPCEDDEGIEEEDV